MAPKARSMNPINVSHMHGRGPTTQAILCYHHRCISRKQIKVELPGLKYMLIWNANIAGSSLTS